MSEEAPEKKWTEWSVVTMNDGTLRCKRTNVEDAKDAEYRQVPRPAFATAELAVMIEFGNARLMPPADIAKECYNRRYRALAFGLCSELNNPVTGTK